MQRNKLVLSGSRSSRDKSNPGIKLSSKARIHFWKAWGQTVGQQPGLKRTYRHTEMQSSKYLRSMTSWKYSRWNASASGSTRSALDSTLTAGVSSCIIVFSAVRTTDTYLPENEEYTWPDAKYYTFPSLAVKPPPSAPLQFLWTHFRNIFNCSTSEHKNQQTKAQNRCQERFSQWSLSRLKIPKISRIRNENARMKDEALPGSLQ